MSKWQFYLDGSLVNDPIGFDDSVINLERDAEIDGLFVKYTNKLKWYGAAYTYIKSVFEANFCNTITVKIYYKCKDGNYDLLFSGIMILSEIEFDEQKCIIDATIEDDSFSGRITRNKNIQAKVDVALSKNQVAITPVTFNQIHPFVVSTGNYYFNNRNFYWVYDCLKFMIDFMTDGTVGFASDYFSTGYGKLAYIIRGEGFNTILADAPTITFKDLFINLNKKFNISFSVQLVAGQRVMRIENKEYFYQNTALTTLPNVPDIIVKIEQQRLYANVKVGSSNVNEDYPALSFPPLRFLNWKQEQYHVLGNCNNDISLDLVNDWIVDSNSIEDILVNGATTYNDNIFFLTSDDGINANRGDPFGVAPPYFYNREVMNDMVIPRWLGGIPNSIAAFLGDGNDVFYAEMGADSSAIGPVSIIPPAPFPTEITDPNNRYNNGTYRYTAPENGLYYFKVGLNFEGLAVFGAPEIFVTIYRFNSLNVNITPNTTDFQIGGIGNGDFTFIYDKGVMYLDQDDYVIVGIEFDGFTAGTLKASSWFTCETTTTGGGIFADFETSSIRPFVFNFKFPVTYADFKNVLDNYSDNIQFYKKQNKYFNGWLEKIVYPVKTGLAQWTIISEKY